MSDPPLENSIGNSVTPSSIEIGESELNSGKIVDSNEEISESGSEESEIEESESEESEESESEESDSESEDNQYNQNGSNDEDDEIGVADEIISEIRRGVYTCLVCTGEIDEESPVWSCHHCFRVYDLNCIKNWAKNGSSTASDNSWRCPSCNGTHHALPKRYSCWCGKVLNPPVNSFTPHSCGQTCNIKFNDCIHGCSFGCHPGPHSKKCTALGPKLRCDCGKEEQQVPCFMTPYQKGWKCQNKCDDILPCGLHKCDKNCHSGLCGICETFIDAKCYCGKANESIPCHEKILKVSELNDKQWIGAYSCEDDCEMTLDCGNHICPLPCHAMTPTIHECLLSPQRVKTCPCGKSKIEDINGVQRKSCLDPIPTCGEICNKILPCGHKCIWECHEGECSPCYVKVDSKCRCNYSQFIIPCSMNQEGFITECTHRCPALLNCRRHRCGNVCCADEPIAMKRERERQKGIRKHSYTADRDDSMTIEATHICLKECGKLLSCEKHYCKMTCHLGPCKPCLESSSDELVCHCGKTIVQAPVRCGTKLPQCLNQCDREPSCGHPAMAHFCHEDDKECPKCVFPVTKKCQCDKQIDVKTVCYQDKVSCQRPCGKLLPCGLHKCIKLCHKPGDCPTKCTQMCSLKRECGHPCKEKCHGLSNPCNENLPCQEIVTIYCECKRISKQIFCNKFKSDSVLECDDECAREKRNKLLMEAFTINESSAESNSNKDYLAKIVMLDNPYNDFLISIYRQQKVWCQKVETTLRQITNGLLGRTSMHFPPMKPIQRRFIHELSQSFNIFAESQDPEPKRSVFIKVETNSKCPQFRLEEVSLAIQRVSDIEKRKQENKKILEDQRKDLENPFFNAIVIKDVFFGVNLIEIENFVLELANQLPNFINPMIKLMDDGSYLLYSESSKNNLELQEDLYDLISILPELLQSKNLAFSCYVCKIDPTASVIIKLDKTKSNKSTRNVTPEPESDLKDEEIVKPLDESTYNWY